jgi:adenosylcobyric acid synthase
MLGRRVLDPDGIESTTPDADGLGLLPLETILTAEKRTEVVTARTPGGTAFGAYAIHAGRTRVLGGASAPPFATLSDGTADGVRGDRVLGTYLHGAFESAALCQEVFGACPADDLKRSSYDRLATWFETHARHVDRLGLTSRTTA